MATKKQLCALKKARSVRKKKSVLKKRRAQQLKTFYKKVGKAYKVYKTKTEPILKERARQGRERFKSEAAIASVKFKAGYASFKQRMKQKKIAKKFKQKGFDVY